MSGREKVTNLCESNCVLLTIDHIKIVTKIMLQKLWSWKNYLTKYSDIFFVIKRTLNPPPKKKKENIESIIYTLQ